MPARNPYGTNPIASMMEEWGQPEATEQRRIGCFRAFGLRVSLGCVAELVFNRSAPGWMKHRVSHETWIGLGAYLRLRVSASMGNRLLGSVLCKPETRSARAGRTKEFVRLARAYEAEEARKRGLVRVATAATVDRLASSLQPFRASGSVRFARSGFSARAGERFRSVRAGRSVANRWTFATRADADRVASGMNQPLRAESAEPIKIARACASLEAVRAGFRLERARAANSVRLIARARSVASLSGFGSGLQAGRSFSQILEAKRARARAFMLLSRVSAVSLSVWIDRESLETLCDRNPMEAIRILRASMPIVRSLTTD
jgi:hypothetical protein